MKTHIIDRVREAEREEWVAELDKLGLPHRPHSLCGQYEPQFAVREDLVSHGEPIGFPDFCRHCLKFYILPVERRPSGWLLRLPHRPVVRQGNKFVMKE